MNPHYFNQKDADNDDMLLKMAIHQGYVPGTCLLGGIVVMAEVELGHDPCRGCSGPRDKCFGRAGDTGE